MSYERFALFVVALAVLVVLYTVVAWLFQDKP